MILNDVNPYSPLTNYDVRDALVKRNSNGAPNIVDNEHFDNYENISIPLFNVNNENHKCISQTTSLNNLTHVPNKCFLW